MQSPMRIEGWVGGASLLAACLLLQSPATAAADDAVPSLHVGIGPRVTQESWYDDGVFDISVVPLVLEVSVSARIGIRARPAVFYRTGAGGISLLGGGVATLFYASPAAAGRPYGGWFAGPAFEITHDRLLSLRHYTFAAEGGYSFNYDGGWAFVVAAQLGATAFSGDAHDPSTHFGIYPSFGLWL